MATGIDPSRAPAISGPQKNMRGHERLSPEKLKEMRGPLTMLVQEIIRSTGPIKSSWQ